MSSNLCRCSKSDLRELIYSCGACAVGFAVAEPVAAEHEQLFNRWIDAGCHGAMAYMANYKNIRLDPRLLLPGAHTVISIAFAYRPVGGYHHSCIADYALGRDYHYVVRTHLKSVVDAITGRYGGLARICVDSAPILERYWAVKAGIGFVGRNRQLIIPNIGSGVFLCEIITTLELPPDTPSEDRCENCGACVDACPEKALLPDGSLDARKCRSYLTIEHRGELPIGTKLGSTIYGCDICQRVCPYNHCEPPETVTEFIPDVRLLKMGPDEFRSISSNGYRRLVANSAMSRVKLSQIIRNSLL